MRARMLVTAGLCGACLGAVPALATQPASSGAGSGGAAAQQTSLPRPVCPPVCGCGPICTVRASSDAPSPGVCLPECRCPPPCPPPCLAGQPCPLIACPAPAPAPAPAPCPACSGASPCYACSA